MTSKKILLVFSVFFVFLATSSWADTYYVDATNGNDYNSGTSESSAWRSISKVNNETFAAGDQVLFKRGEIWNETLNITDDGTGENYITFSSYGTGDKPIIDGKSNQLNGIVISGRSYINISNFEIQHLDSTNACNGIRIVGGSHHINIKNVEIHDTNSRGIYMEGVSSSNYTEDIVIDGCTLYDIAPWGDSGASDIGINHYSRKITVKNCTMYGNGVDRGVDGITWHAARGAGCYIYNNTIYDHQENEIDVKYHWESSDGEGPTIIEGNDCWGSDNFAVVEFHYGTQDVHLLRNKIHDGNDLGFQIYNHGGSSPDGQEGNCIIAYNLIYDNQLAGIGIHQSNVGNNEIYNNVVVNNGLKTDPWSWSAYIYAPDCNIVNNIFYKNGKGRGSSSSPQLRLGSNYGSLNLDYNLVVQPSSEYTHRLDGSYRTFEWMQQNTSYCQDSFGGNTDYPWPFVDSTNSLDFRLASDSELIDAGYFIDELKDYAGNTVPNGEGVDIGAYEYYSSTSSDDLLPPDNLSINLQQ